MGFTRQATALSFVLIALCSINNKQILRFVTFFILVVFNILYNGFDIEDEINKLISRPLTIENI